MKQLISRLGSDLSKEWKNVKCFYLRRVSQVITGITKNEFDHNLSTRYEPPGENVGRDLTLVLLGLALLGQETWADGTLGLIQLLTVDFCPLHPSQLSWFVFHKTVHSKEESKEHHFRGPF